MTFASSTYDRMAGKQQCYKVKMVVGRRSDCAREFVCTAATDSYTQRTM